MEGDAKAVLKLLAMATVNRKAEVIAWMNDRGWAQLSPSAPLVVLNSAIADNIQDPKFQNELAVLLAGGDPEYLHIEVLTIIAIVGGIVAIVGGTVKAVQLTKTGRLARAMGMDAFRGQRGQYEWLKKQAEIKARRDFIVSLASEQQKLLAEEEIELLISEKGKRRTVIGLVLLGAIGVPLLYYFSIKQ